MEKNNKHPGHIQGYNGSFEELAKAIGCMRYDKISEFVGEFSKEFKRQAKEDLELRGRKKLSEKLSKVSQDFEQVKKDIDSAWEVCKPFMKGSQSKLFFFVLLTQSL
ncbi:MAG: hypothetical protein PHR57_02105 [Patescibacteria group bacterium]|nr:hypothetical protein [Patescibacteria group bacterium]